MQALASLIKIAKANGASDLHLESGLPAALRIDGKIKTHGNVITAETLMAAARQLIGESNWSQFLHKGSYDLSVTIEKVRCRINILKTLRGIGLAIRLLSAFQPSLKKLNLHPDLLEILRHPHGLVLISGPTGSGKSSTLAALVEEINRRHAKHIITIESPIEYHFRPQQAYIRQREVGRNTPSFSQGLIDALREDPDVLLIGEMREPEVMRQTLNAAETGHLVLTTLHSGSVVETLQRIVAAFGTEYQYGVRAQLADALMAVVCQRLIYLPDLNIRVPECEILFTNLTAKSVIREGKFFKLNDVIQTGAQDRMWSYDRYRKWLNSRKDWYVGGAVDPDGAAAVVSVVNEMDPPKRSNQRSVKQTHPTGPTMPPKPPQSTPSSPRTTPSVPRPKADQFYEIGDAGSDSVEEILKELNAIKKKRR